MFATESTAAEKVAPVEARSWGEYTKQAASTVAAAIKLKAGRIRAMRR